MLHLETVFGTITNVRHDDRGEPILTVTLDDPGQTAEGLYFAREGELLPTFQWHMLHLDRALTGKEWTQALHTARQKRWNTALDWLSNYDIWYLSDGGYSRIGFDWESRRLFLCSESREEVKAEWPHCSTQIAAVEAALRACLIAAGVVPPQN
jgi:hypothetical protein